MINLISRKVLRYLLKCGVVDNNEDECSHYLYGIEITISSLLNIFLIMSIGTLLGCIQYSFVFLFVFISLRHMTGGYHAKTYFKCNFSLCVIFCFDIFVAKYIGQYINKTICIIILMICTLIALIYCPIVNENKQVKEELRPIYKILSLMLTYIYGGIGILLIPSTNKIGIIIILTIFLIYLLVIVARVIEGGEKYGKKEC